MKTLFVIDNLFVGGITSSLLNILPHYVKRSDCDLIVFDDRFDGAILPSNVHAFCPSKLLSILGNPLSKLKNRPLLFIVKLWLLFLSKVFSGKTARAFLFLFVRKRYKYDVAISFCHDNGWKSLSKGCNDYVLKKVNASAKISWIHCDYSSYGGFDKRDISKYQNFDYIVNVSESCSKRFCSLFPSLTDKCRVVENFQSNQIVKIDHYHEYKENCFNVLTVCRISSVKGLDRAIEAFNKLVQEGLTNFTWTIVGDGPEKNRLIERVKELSLDSMIAFVGQSDCPQLYMKNADLFLLPSIHEAAPMVFGECAQFKLFVLSTNTCSAKELVLDRGIGVVCDNSVEGLYEYLKKFITKEIIPQNNALYFESYSHAEERLNSFIGEICSKYGY